MNITGKVIVNLLALSNDIIDREIKCVDLCKQIYSQTTLYPSL